MTGTLGKIRAAIAVHEGKLAELRAAEKVVTILEGEAVKNTAPVDGRPAQKQTVGATIMDMLSDGHKSLAVILERVHASGKETTNQSISSALQVLRKKGLVVRKGREWKVK